MKRYDLITNYRAGSSIEEMEPADDGEWVRWDDVQAELKATRERADREAAGRVRVHIALAKAIGGDAASRINDDPPPQENEA